MASESRVDFSVVIPVYQEAEEINPCISRVLSMVGAERAELIVVDGDNGSTLEHIETDDPRVRGVLCAPGRGVQLNEGARAARGAFLVFLHVDTRLPRLGLKAVERSLGRYEAGAFDVRIVSTNYGVKAISITASFRSRITRVPYGDQTHFVRRDTFFRVGGYPDTPVMEDVDFMYRLKRLGIPITLLSECSYTSDRRWRFGGVARNTLRNWKLVFLYTFGATPESIRRRYHPHSLLRRPTSGRVSPVCTEATCER